MREEGPPLMVKAELANHLQNEKFKLMHNRATRSDDKRHSMRHNLAAQGERRAPR